MVVIQYSLGHLLYIYARANHHRTRYVQVLDFVESRRARIPSAIRRRRRSRPNVPRPLGRHRRVLRVELQTPIVCVAAVRQRRQPTRDQHRGRVERREIAREALRVHVSWGAGKRVGRAASSIGRGRGDTSDDGVGVRITLWVVKM